MARQFQPPTQIRQAPTKEEALLAPITNTIQSLPALYDQYKLQRMQQAMALKEQEFKQRDLESRLGTGIYENVQPGKVLSSPPPTAGPEEQLFGAEISPPTFSEETFDQKKKRVGTEGLRAETDYLTATAKSKEVTGQNNDKNFTQENQLRTQYLGQIKDFKTVRDSFSRLKASAKDPSAAGDLALIFNYMKILDPGSTVREGEFATAQNAAGVDQRTIALYNKISKGERMSTAQRADFLDRAGRLYGSQEDVYKKEAKEFKRVAEKAGLDPDQVVLDMVLDQSRGVPQGESAAPIQGGAVEHDEALSWAKSNPNDPRAQRILKLHGL